jgi:hypothetical protein
MIVRTLTENFHWFLRCIFFCRHLKQFSTTYSSSSSSSSKKDLSVMPNIQHIMYTQHKATNTPKNEDVSICGVKRRSYGHHLAAVMI